MRLVPCGGVGDPWAALFRGQGIAEPVRRADKARGHSGRGLDGQQLIDPRLVETTATLGERFGQDQMRLRAVELDVFEATGRHDRQVGTPPRTDGFIRGAPFVFASLQGEQHPRRDRTATAVGALGETAGTTSLDGLDHRGPRKRIGPLADGMGVGDDVGNLEAGTIAAEPMLHVAESTPRESSFSMSSEGSGDNHTRHITITSLRRGEKISDH